MRYTIAAALVAASIATAAPAYAAHDTATPVARYADTAGHLTTATIAAEAAFTTTPTLRALDRDTRRANAAARSSRAGQRGGAGPYLDSNYAPVWKRVSPYARSVWLCIRRHESIMAGHYTAANRVSTASGAGQWLDSTWAGVARWVKVHNEYVARRYSRAMYAPAWVQDAAYVHVYRHGGLSMWRGTGCPGT